jgi:hypothetical protein
MAETMRFRVLRPHDGDRFYQEGEERRGTMADLGHLVPRTLEPLGASDEARAEPKAEPAPKNKAEPAAPANKAATTRARRAR